MYDKIFLVDAFLMRFEKVNMPLDKVLDMEAIASKYYDTVTKTEFRNSTGLDSNTLKEYREWVRK